MKYMRNPEILRICVMTKLTYEEWSEKNPIDWDKIKDNEDCLVTKDLVEMVHHWEYQRYCKEND